MYRIFKHNNIGLQQFKVEEWHHPFYAYTDKLLELGVLIEFYTAEIGEGEDDYEEETSVLVLTHTEACSYSFVLFHSYDVIGPVPLYRIIADAIDFIEHSSRKTLLDDLEDISTGGTSSDMMETEAERDMIYKSDVRKFNSVVDLIRQRRWSEN